MRHDKETPQQDLNLLNIARAIRAASLDLDTGRLVGQGEPDDKVAALYNALAEVSELGRTNEACRLLVSNLQKLAGPYGALWQAVAVQEQLDAGKITHTALADPEIDLSLAGRVSAAVHIANNRSDLQSTTTTCTDETS